MFHTSKKPSGKTQMSNKIGPKSMPKATNSSKRKVSTHIRPQSK